MSAYSSTAVTADDPDLFGAVFRPAGRVTITAGGRFAGSVTRVDLGHLSMLTGTQTLPAIFEGGLSSERHGISFHPRPGPDFVSHGIEIGASDIAVTNNPRLGVSHRSFCSTEWAGMSLPISVWSEFSIAIVGNDTPTSHKVTPSASALERLRRIYAAVISTVNHTPDVIENRDAVQSLQSEVIEAAVDCLRSPSVEESTRAYRHHTDIMKRFHRALEECDDWPLYVPQLCATLGVAARTLRLCCCEHLGMGPHRYLYLRRMHLARRALMVGGSKTDRVTDIAMRFGFWELGRFAVDYKALFAESPSVTLKREAP